MIDRNMNPRGRKTIEIDEGGFADGSIPRWQAA